MPPHASGLSVRVQVSSSPSGSPATPAVRLPRPVSLRAVADVAKRVLEAERVSHASLDITFVSARRIAAMNVKHLQHRGPTDVISFGFERASADGPVEGDIYIAPEIAKRNAAAAGERFATEIVRLVIHGTLHVLGHDHPEDDARYTSAMWKRQEALLRRELGRA